MRKVAWGAGLNVIVFAATLFVGFFLTPYLIRSLGKADYDIWCVVEAVLAYFTLLDLGVAAYLVRMTARGKVSADLVSFNQTASAAAAVFVCGSAIVLTLGGLALWLVGNSFAERAGDATQMSWFLLLMLFNLALVLPLSIFPAMLDGLEEFAAKATIRLMFLCLRTVLLLLLLGQGYGLLGVGLAIVSTTVAEHICCALRCYHVRRGLRVAPWRARRVEMRNAITSSVDAFLAMLSGRVTLQSGAILVGLFLAEGRVTELTIAVRLGEYAKQLLRQLTTTLTPGISALEARGDWPGIRRLFLVGSYWLWVLSWPVHLGLWWFGRSFLAAWVGEEFYQTSGLALLVVATTVAPAMLQSVAARVLYGLGRLRFFARVAIAEGVVNLLLTLLLIRSFGVVGVAWAIMLPNVVASLIVIGYVLRLLEIRVDSYLKQLFAPLVASMPMMLVWYLLGESAPSYTSLLVHGLPGVVVYASVLGVLHWHRRRYPGRYFGRHSVSASVSHAGALPTMGAAH